jgi:uncharacterized Zn-finger protein
MNKVTYVNESVVFCEGEQETDTHPRIYLEAEKNNMPLL